MPRRRREQRFHQPSAAYSERRSAKLLGSNLEEYRAAALRSIADDSNDGTERKGTIICPACRRVMHYAILTSRGTAGPEASAACERNDCLGLIGELPAREPLPPPRRVSLRSKNDAHYFVALNGSPWRIHDRVFAKQTVPVGDPSAIERVFVARNRDRRVYPFGEGDLRSLILGQVERQFLAASPVKRSGPARLIDVDPAGTFPAMDV